jgi:hypothetical protein
MPTWDGGGSVGIVQGLASEGIALVDEQLDAVVSGFSTTAKYCPPRSTSNISQQEISKTSVQGMENRTEQGQDVGGKVRNFVTSLNGVQVKQCRFTAP